MMKIIQLEDPSQFDGLKGPWSALLAECATATINSTFAWLSVWWEHFGGDRKLFILLAEEDQQILGIAPLMISTSPAVKGLARQRTIRFLGEGKSDYGDFIIPDRHEEVMTAFVDHLLANRKHWDGIDLRELREDSPNLDPFVAAVETRGLSCETRAGATCLQARLTGTWNDYYDQLRAKFRSDVRRRLAKLEAVGPVSLMRYGTADEALWQDLLQVNLKHHSEKNKQDLRQDLTFLRHLSEVMGREGMLDIAVLRVGSAAAAFNLGLRFRDIVYHWRVGFLPELYKFAPGRLLIRFLLEDCSGTETTCLDFMRGTEDYKRAWAFDERRNLNLAVVNNRLTSRVKTKLRRARVSDRGRRRKSIGQTH